MERRRFIQAALATAALTLRADNHPRVSAQSPDNQKFYNLFDNLANLQRPQLQTQEAPFSRKLHLNLALATQPFITSLSSESDPTDTFRTSHISTPSFENIAAREIEITALADPNSPLSNGIHIIATIPPTSQTLISLIDNNPSSEPSSHIFSPDYTSRSATFSEIQSLIFDLGRASFTQSQDTIAPITIPSQIG